MRARWQTEQWSAWVWLDVALAGLLTLGAELELRGSSDASWHAAGHALLMLPQTLPVAVRRLAPVGALLVGFVGTMAEDLALGPTSTLSELIAFLLLTFALGRYVSGRRLLAMVALVAAACVEHSVVQALQTAGTPVDSDFVLDLVFAAFFGGVAIVLGVFIRHREEDRERDVAAAVADERARIARELHDVVAHGMGVMVVQASAAEQLLHSDPARAVEPLSTVRQTGQDSLAEMRRLLGLLRDGGDDRTAPQPDLEALPSLVERLRGSGLPVTFEVRGTPVPVPQGLGVSAYRIVQEALTNALKHAGPVATDVTVDWRPDVLHLRIHNQAGHAPATDGAGHGLIGMRERVRLYAGTLDAARQPDGSFAVDAVLPVPA